MNIEINKLEEMLLSQLAENMSVNGFIKRRGQSFQKVFEWGKCSFHISFIEHKRDIDVTADIAVRFDGLEELVQKNNTRLNETEKRNVFSLGAELGNIRDGRQKRWTISSESDIYKVAAEIFDCFMTVGVPYLERFSDMAVALDVFSSDEPSAWIHSPIHGERAKRAVGIAWLMNDKKRVDQLIDSKSRFLEHRNDFGLSSFRAFVASLGK